MRVAVLNDVHGNLPALEAVLAELEPEAVDAYVFGGDIVAGPLPRQTLERVLALGERAHLLRGNADREALEVRDDREPRAGGLVDAALADDLTDEQAALLRSLPLTVTLEVDGLGPTLFCHATPRDDEEIFTERDPDEVVAGMLAGVEPETVVCGHTHLQVDRRAGRWRVVCAGSVGFPNDDVGAHYALLGPDVDLRRTDYDRDGALELFERSAWMQSGDLERKRGFLRGLHEANDRDEVLDFFAEVVARQRGA